MCPCEMLAAFLLRNGRRIRLPEQLRSPGPSGLGGWLDYRAAGRCTQPESCPATEFHPPPAFLLHAPRRAAPAGRRPKFDRRAGSAKPKRPMVPALDRSVRPCELSAQFGLPQQPVTVSSPVLFSVSHIPDLDLTLILDKLQHAHSHWKTWRFAPDAYRLAGQTVPNRCRPKQGRRRNLRR